MKKIVELPVVEPLYSTYGHQAIGCAVIEANPSIRNWYLNNVMRLVCNTKFCFGATSPFIKLEFSNYSANPHLERKWFDLRFLKGYTDAVILELLDHDYYVAFNGIDDYYVEGKSWYQEEHVGHDGMICGYDQEAKTYSIHAYDKRWIYQVFKTPQKAFNAGRISMLERGEDVKICGIKPKLDYVPLEPDVICLKLREYLDSSLDNYPVEEDKMVYGSVVHEYIAMYVDKLFDGSVPYHRMDRRVMRQIWEHKKVMHERLVKVEEALQMDSSLSTAYEKLVPEANSARMLYASHNMKRRDAALPIISKKLRWMQETEQEILHAFIEKVEGALK